MDKELLKEEIIKTFKKWLKLSHYRVFLFGSRINGKADARSDIDIGIEAKEEVPAVVLNEIKNELEGLPLLQKFDVVDFHNVSERFKKTALKDIEVIYEQ